MPDGLCGGEGGGRCTAPQGADKLRGPQDPPFRDAQTAPETRGGLFAVILLAPGVGEQIEEVSMRGLLRAKPFARLGGHRGVSGDQVAAGRGAVAVGVPLKVQLEAASPRPDDDQTERALHDPPDLSAGYGRVSSRRSGAPVSDPRLLQNLP
jgi:hypothetical protein